MPAFPAILRRLYDRLPLGHEPGIPHDAGVSVRLAQEAYVRRLLEEPRYQSGRRLHRYEHQVFSQNGEDGVIREIFRRLGIAGRSFLEIGVGNGQRNNTAFLLTQGWQGYWIEGNPASVAGIRQSFGKPISDRQLRVREVVVTRENVREEVASLGVPAGLDLLSVDVDRNTYWILDALLTTVSPRVLVVEYNALYPPDMEWKVEYDPSRWWNRTSYYGASLKSYERLCQRHELALVGCELHGVNAFFVRRELCGDHFEAPFTAENHYEPPRYFLVRTQGYPPCFSDLSE